MKQITKLAIIGGTGKSGKYLVKQLISQGLHFKILLRTAANFQIESPLIEIVEGNVRDYETVRLLVEDCQAVISALGLGQPPSELSIFTQATKNVIRAMNECNIHRYIVTTGLNVDTPFDKKSPKTQSATDWMKTNFPKSTLDKQEEFDLLAKSNLDWTLVRLPLIEQTDERRKILISLEDCVGDKISATDLAYFLIEQVFDDSCIRKSPFISNA
jgi:putative NADH-flavin reductase